MGVCHRISSPRGGGLVTMTVTNPHLAPPMPVWGVVGHNIDRCIRLQRCQPFFGEKRSSFVYPSPGLSFEDKFLTVFLSLKLYIG